MIYLLSLLLLLPDYHIIGPGFISSADPGVLEAVAERRVQANWGLSGDWTAYDVLVATADCRNLGRSGWLIANRNVYTSIVVDCENGEHRGQMAERGLLADANRRELAHKQGWLVLR